MECVQHDTFNLVFIHKFYHAHEALSLKNIEDN